MRRQEQGASEIMPSPVVSKLQTKAKSFVVLDEELMPYNWALDKMRVLANSACKNSYPATLLLTEHEPFITLGRRADMSEVRTYVTYLAECGIMVHRMERGGLATVHGPGQIMV